MSKVFEAPQQKILQWMRSDSNRFDITGLDHWQSLLALKDWLSEDKTIKNLVLVMDPNTIHDDFLDKLTDAMPEWETCMLPAFDVSPYASIVQSERALRERWSTLHRIMSSNKRKIIVTSLDGIAIKNPPRSFFENRSQVINVSDIISPLELAAKLIEMGYQNNITVEEPGQFSQKGEIFDVFPLSGTPIRIHYFDDMVEEIFAIDPDTNKTLRDQKFEQILIGPSIGILCQKDFTLNLRESIPQPAPGHPFKFERRKNIFRSLSEEQLFENFSTLAPLFFKENSSFSDYLNIQESLFLLFDFKSNNADFLAKLDQYFHEFSELLEDVESDCVVPEPTKLFDPIVDVLEHSKSLSIERLQIHEDLDLDLKSNIHFNLVPVSQYLNKYINPNLSKHEITKILFNEVLKEIGKDVSIYITCTNDFAKDEVLKLLEHLEISENIIKRIQFLSFPLAYGFYYEKERLLFIKDSELLSPKRRQTYKRKAKSYDLFAEQLATLKQGDFVIHTNHGLGIYQGLEQMELGGIKNDFVVIEYQDRDKIYLPVYKLDLIQKQADATAELKPENLRKSKFNQAKSKARESAKKLAFDLLQLQASRESQEAYQFTPPDEHFFDFESAFPYKETIDQHDAIIKVIETMQKPKPMDFLVCGDVGFGKTEVAMRAAFKAVLDKKQVAILVPTTILALQHFNSFSARFKDFPVNIEFLSRFKKPTESKQILENLKEGKVDIVIGTHRLLAKNVQFHDLGLVIVDEEQRFGVGHKEKMKLLKSTVDFLTLTATPIPRTMQLAFLGLRDLALIKTPPPKRQSIKTYLIKEDQETIRKALTRELSRGGQVFIVHNKVQDIEHYTAQIRELVPTAKIVFAHGQLPEKELEKRMADFYAGKYQILISTTIIESGIDIPNANTMIVDRADTFGLSQLHQLRGRIGRSDRKAYAYFVIPKHKPLSETATQRLKALQMYTDIGSGFQLATCDLEIRGAGDILGAEQSGHLTTVGLELYLQLLKEAIAELRGEKEEINKNIEISTPFVAHIPRKYIPNDAERLKTYKKLSNYNDLNEIEIYEDELQDIYGPLPFEATNLITILKVRILFGKLHVNNISITGPNMLIKFDPASLENDHDFRNKAVEYFLGHKKRFQFSPDFSVTYSPKNPISAENFLEIASDLSSELVSFKH